MSALERYAAQLRYAVRELGRKRATFAAVEEFVQAVERVASSMETESQLLEGSRGEPEPSPGSAPRVAADPAPSPRDPPQALMDATLDVLPGPVLHSVSFQHRPMEAE